jgi:NSS family neurotransmitter:Na+ symporter
MPPLKPQREKWSSLLAFVWVGTGAAVGLGNVWKFPYMAGSNGGGAFVLLYMAFVLAVAIPVMIAEIMLGKIGQKNPVDTFKNLAVSHKLSPAWRHTGYLGCVTLFLIFCFYSVVAGWSLAYLRLAMSNAFYQATPETVQNLWVSLLASPTQMVGYTVLFVLLTMGIVWLGVKKGIEKSCSIMMPGLFIVLIVLVLYAASRFGLEKSFHFLFAFEPSKITPAIIISSLGHAFFTLAVGACAMMVYGSYLPKNVSVVKSVFMIAALDVIVALLSGLAIFPLVLENNMSPSQGPGLMFISLPMVFAHIPFGAFWATMFFVLLFFAALSSSLSFAEPLVNFAMEKLKFSRQLATLSITLMTAVGGSICALSFNLWQEIKLGSLGLFDLVADISTNLLLPTGAIAIAIFAGLVVDRNAYTSTDLAVEKNSFRIWRFLTLYVAPVAIAVVLVNSLVGMF